MDPTPDLKLNDDFTPVLANGDFVLEPYPDQRSQQLILLARTGNFRAAPLTGVAIAAQTNADASPPALQRLKQRISTQMQADGFTQIDALNVRLDNLLKIKIELSASRPQKR